MNPRLLYIDQDYSLSRAIDADVKRREQSIVVDMLREKFDISRGYNLGNHTIEEVAKTFEHRPFQALVTHFPTNTIRLGKTNIEVYARSTEIIRVIKAAMPKLRIVIYTREGSLMPSLVKSAGADIFVPKSSNPREDGRHITQALEGMSYF